MPAACNSRLYTCSFSTKIEQTTIKAESYKAYLATGIDAPCAIVPIPLTTFFYFFTFSLFSVFVLSSSFFIIIIIIIFFFKIWDWKLLYFFTLNPTIKSTCNSFVISIPIRIILISLFTHDSLLVSIFFTLMCSNYYLTTCNSNPF